MGTSHSQSSSITTKASQSDSLASRTLVKGKVLPPCRDAVGVFYSLPPADWAELMGYLMLKFGSFAIRTIYILKRFIVFVFFFLIVFVFVRQ